MKLTFLSSALLLASTAIAVPVTLKQRLQARAAAKNAQEVNGARNSWIDDRIVVRGRGSANTVISPNWAGAAISDTKVTKVQGTWTVPAVSAPKHGDDWPCNAAVWVGIDGFKCMSALLQTGTSMIVESGIPRYYGWYEWYPADAETIPDFPVSPGDVISATVEATSPVSGTATLHNHSTGIKYIHFFNDMGSVGRLCMQDAEWIVETTGADGEQGFLPAFESVQISDASCTTSGSTHGVSGATLMELLDANEKEVLTVCTTMGDDSVDCLNTGPS